MLFTLIVATLALVSQSASQVDSSNLPPLILPGRVNNTTGQSCPPEEVRERGRNEVDENIQDLLRTVVVPSCLLFSTQSSPAVSCSALPTSCPSGYYWIRSSNGSAVQLYCDMDRVCGCTGTGGGWTRVAFLNMTSPDQQCPGAWMLQIRSTEPRRLCGVNISSHQACFSAMFSTYDISYNHVCGRVRGYHYSTTLGFGTSNSSIDSFYVDGVSLTHGPPGARQHIWSFAAGYGEHNIYDNGCPCANLSRPLARVPFFVGNDFFCESGNPVAYSGRGGLYQNDPLWDGQGCGSPPCCELSYPPGVTAPWFCKQLPQTTTDDIEARICHGSIHPEDTPVELVELYIR